MDHDDQDSRCQPDMGVAHGGQIGSGGDQGDNDVEHGIRDFFGSLQFPKWRHSQDHTENSYNQHRPGGFVKHRKYLVDPHAQFLGYCGN